MTYFNILKLFIFALLLVTITLITYIDITFIDETYEYNTIIRIGNFGLNFLYFKYLCNNIPSLNETVEGLNNSPENKRLEFTLKGTKIGTMVIFIFVFVHLLITFLLAEYINNKLLENDNVEIKALVRDCVILKGSRNCKYLYFVNNKYYEHKFDNQKYNNNDSIEIIYCKRLPVISRLK